MDNRILELAIEALENRKAAVELEIQSIRSTQKGDVAVDVAADAAPRPRKPKSAAERKAQSVRMIAFWKQRRQTKMKAKNAKVAEVAPAKKKSSSNAANQARSEKLRAYWAKKKAASGKK